MNTCPCFVKSQKQKFIHTQNPQKSNFTIILMYINSRKAQTTPINHCSNSVVWTNHRRINTVKYIDLKWFFKQTVPFFQKFITQFIYSFVWLESMWSNIGFGMGSIKCTPNLSPPQRERLFSKSNKPITSS